MNIKNLFEFNKSPKYTISDLLNKTPLGYRIRSKDITNVTYLGYKFILKKQNIFSRLNLYIKKLFSKYKQEEVLVSWVRFYFRVQSATYKNKYHTLFIEVPFRRDYTKYKLRELPVKYFCSCESYKFFIAYVLNRSHNIIITNSIIKYLNIALTKKPKIRNPREIQFFCKHCYAVILEIEGITVNNFLKKEYNGSNKYE